MQPEIINSFIFPRYVGINIDAGKLVSRYNKEQSKRTRSDCKKVVAIINGNEFNFDKFSDCLAQVGMAHSKVKQLIQNGKSITRRNGDVMYFKKG